MQVACTKILFLLLVCSVFQFLILKKVQKEVFLLVRKMIISCSHHIVHLNNYCYISRGTLRMLSCAMSVSLSISNPVWIHNAQVFLQLLFKLVYWYLHYQFISLAYRVSSCLHVNHCTCDFCSANSECYMQQWTEVLCDLLLPLSF